MDALQFANDYENEEQELLVLIGDSSACGSGGRGNCVAQWTFLAYIDLQTNRLHVGEGRLVWPTTAGEEESRSYFNRFDKGCVYRVCARRLMNRTVSDGMLPCHFNRFYLTDVLKSKVSCATLENIIAEYRKPVIIQDEALGELTLNRELALFRGCVDWLGRDISINLDVNMNDEASWTTARKAMAQLHANQRRWDERMRHFSAQALTELANEWQANEDDDAPEITEQGFIEKIRLQELSVTGDGDFTAYYSDGDMFWGHIIEVNGNLQSGVDFADIAG